MTDYNNDDSKVSRYINYIVNHPKRTLGIFFVIFISLMPFLQNQADFTYRTWFRTSDPLLSEFDKFERKFGNDDSIVIAINSKSGIFDKNSVKLVQDLTHDMWRVHNVIRVDSLSNYNWVHGEEDSIVVDPLLEPEDGKLTKEFLAQRKKIALNDETIPNYLLSKDAKTTVMFARIKPAVVNLARVITNFGSDGLVVKAITKINKYKIGKSAKVQRSTRASGSFKAIFLR